jgi:hypothetical protein
MRPGRIHQYRGVIIKGSLAGYKCAAFQISEGHKDEAFLKLLHTKEKVNEGNVKEEFGEIDLPPSTLPPDVHENTRKLGLLTADLTFLAKCWSTILMFDLISNGKLWKRCRLGGDSEGKTCSYATKHTSGDIEADISYRKRMVGAGGRF